MAVVLLIYNCYKISSQTFYYVVTDEQFIVKNYLRPFSTVSYELSQIEAVEITKVSLVRPKHQVCIYLADNHIIRFDKCDIKLSILDAMRAGLQAKGLSVTYGDKTLDRL